MNQQQSSQGTKLLFAVSKKILFAKNTVEAMKKAMTAGGQNPVQTLAKMAAMIMKKAIEQAQQADQQTQLVPEDIMRAFYLLTREITQIVRKGSGMSNNDAKRMGEALLVETVRIFQEMSDPAQVEKIAQQRGQQMQQGGQQPMPEQPPQQGGLVQSAMG